MKTKAKSAKKKVATKKVSEKDFVKGINKVTEMFLAKMQNVSDNNKDRFPVGIVYLQTDGKFSLLTNADFKEDAFNGMAVLTIDRVSDKLVSSNIK